MSGRDIPDEELSDTDRKLVDLIEGDYVDGMVTGWVLVGSYIDVEDGSPRYFSHTMRGQSTAMTLGQLEHHRVITEAHVVRHHFDHD